MTSNFHDMMALQREVERAKKQMLLFQESPTARIMKETQQAFLQQQALMLPTLSPLREELDRHRRMMEEIKAIRLPSFALNDFQQIKATVFPDELLCNKRVLEQMRALSRPSLTIDLQRLLPDRSHWQHIHNQTAMFERVRLQAAMVSQNFKEFAWAQQLATRPTMYAVGHINETANLITRWEQAGRGVGALAASIACAETQAISQESEILVYPEAFDFKQIEVEESQDDAFLPTHNLYYVQRTELIYVARSNPRFLEDETLLDGLGTAQYFNCAQAVCNYVSQINRLCKAIGKQPVFRLTEQLMQSLVSLPNIYAVRRNHFCEFIDHLYFIIYEGAGKDNLRFLSVIGDDNAEPVWMLKHLRNYYARHNVEHGSEPDIKKKQERLGHIFIELIGKPQPRMRREFAAAQLTFLRRIEGMLRLIYEKIEEQATAIGNGSDDGSTND